MSLLGIDIAWARPGVDGIKATGAKWVARYFSNDPTKDLTAGEVSQYLAAGLGIVTVFETTTGRALQGRIAGVDDAHSAVNERAAVGLPSTAPIYWSVDTDTDYASVKAYADGWASVIPKSMSGPYGGYKVVEGAHYDGWTYGWQTTAWSGGQWSQWASIKQTGGTVLSGGADIDYAEVPDFGQYPRPETDMPLTAADVNLILETRMPAFAAVPGPDGKPYIPTVAEVLNGAKTADTQITALTAQVQALTSEVAKLTGGGVDPTAVAKAVVHDIGQGLSGL